MADERQTSEYWYLADIDSLVRYDDAVDLAAERHLGNVADLDLGQVRRDLQQGLVNEGWKVRVYIPFGTEWYPYLMRRLAERPANVLFLARNLFRQ